MSKIFIEYKDVFAIGGHLYLVFQDNGGAEFVIRGGNPLSTGTIIMEVSVPIAQSDDYRGSETPQSRGQRELDLGGRTAEDVWDIMKQQATVIGSANLPYTPLPPNAQNSNSTIASILHTVGIDPFYNLPIGVGAAPFVGLTNFLDISSSLFGTSRNDIIWGHTGDDILRGGIGNDSLTGGLGARDTLYGGAGNDVLIDDNGGNLLDEGGNDAYVLSMDFGSTLSSSYRNSYIEDSDGLGSLTINNILVEGLATVAQRDTLGKAVVWAIDGFYLTRYNTTNMKLSQTIGGTQSNPLATGATILIQSLSPAQSWLGITIDTVNNGTAGNDRFYGDVYAETFNGLTGNDTISADAGNDTLVGGTGADSLQGGVGNDKYVYGKLDGADIISESGTASDTADSLIISGYTSAATTFTRVGNTSDLAIGFTGSSTDSIVLKFGLEGNYSVESFVFASGGTKTIAAIRADVLAAQTTAGNDNTPAFRACA